MPRTYYSHHPWTFRPSDFCVFVLEVTPALLHPPRLFDNDNINSDNSYGARAQASSAAYCNGNASRHSISDSSRATVSILCAFSKARLLADLHADFGNSTSRNQSESPLLQLPAELRNIIYTYVLQEHSRVAAFPLRNTGPRRYPLALLFVCRQIHAETALLPYALNTFLVGDITCYIDDALGFLRNRSPAQLRSIQYLYIYYNIHGSIRGVNSTMDGFKFLDMLPRLRTLQIRHDSYDMLVRIDGDEIQCFMCPWRSGFNFGDKIRADLEARFRAWKPGVNMTFQMVTEHTMTKW